MTLFVDLETRSSAKLDKTGVYPYCEDLDFGILMVSWALDDGPVGTATTTEEILAIPGLFDRDVTKVAHNAQFDRVCLSRIAPAVAKTRQGFLRPEEWQDTMAVAAEWALPRSLNALAKELGTAEKDEAGKDLIKLFCQPPFARPEDHPLEWMDFVAYCEQDVETLREVYSRLPAMTPTEQRVWEVDQHINDNGLRVDVPLITAARGMAVENRDRMTEEARAVTGLANPASPIQLQTWLKERGCLLPNMQAATITTALETATGDVRRMLEYRQEVSLSAAGKFQTGLTNLSQDGRIRGSLRFHKAHTGRWAGRGLQPQNLPRAAFSSVVDESLAIDDVVSGVNVPQSELKQLVRALFVGPFTVVDYAAIEARVLAWLAGETWALEAFREGRDIYQESAKMMGPSFTRAQGKVAVLALGYNGGPTSLRAMGYGGRPRSAKEVLEFYRRTGEEPPPDIEADAGDPTKGAGEYLPDAVLRRTLVLPWRRVNARIVRYWQDLEDAFVRGAGGVGAGHLVVERSGADRHLVLPSGRRLVYHDVRRVGGRLTFIDHTRGSSRQQTYGGRLTENVTQAVARDVLAEALVRLHDAGYRIAAHVHDEVIVEGTGYGSVRAVSSLMTVNPRWAEGLPLDGEGFTCERYRKG